MHWEAFCCPAPARAARAYLYENGFDALEVPVHGPEGRLHVCRVAELAPGDIFGELAVLQAPKSWRTATVTTSDMETVVFSLKQEAVFRLIPDARRVTLEFRLIPRHTIIFSRSGITKLIPRRFAPCIADRGH